MPGRAGGGSTGGGGQDGGSSGGGRPGGNQGSSRPDRNPGGPSGGKSGPAGRTAGENESSSSGGGGNTTSLADLTRELATGPIGPSLTNLASPTIGVSSGLGFTDASGLSGNALDKALADINAARAPEEVGFNKKAALALLGFVAPELAGMVALGMAASELVGSIEGTEALGQGVSPDFDPEQKGERQAQRDTPTEKAVGPVRKEKSEKAAPTGFETPLFDQILGNILEGKSPLEAITFERFESNLPSNIKEISSGII